MLMGSKRSSHFPKALRSPKNFGGLVAGEMLRVTSPLRVGLEATVEPGIVGLKLLALGLGLNSLAAALNFADVAEGGPRRVADFWGLVMPLETPPALLEAVGVSLRVRGGGMVAAAAAAAA